MQYHKVVSKIIKILKENENWFETFEHEPVKTSEEAAKVRIGYNLKQGAKAMIIRIKITDSVKKFIMLVIPGDKRFDESKVKQFYTAKDIRFATEKEVFDITGGVLPGGVPPFGNIFGLEVVTDPSVFENEYIIFNAGDRRFSVAMRSKDYKILVNPTVCSIT